MEFEDEWGKLQAESTAQLRASGRTSSHGADQSHTRLNGTSPGTPSGGGDDQELASSASKKRAAVTALEQHIQPDTGTAGKLMDEAMETAGKGFKDWATGAGINEALKGWRASVKALQIRLANEKAALSGTNVLLHGADKGLGSEFDRRFPPIAPPPPSAGPGPVGGKLPFTSRLADY
ncbi:hypothetical protein IPZ58_23775 [Streptomyces roseoverticillatus]|uniref:hypothetical protein n=1 Tax=Streptomyces roseoverticillatus TaxID=66429 RepID=UPI001F21874F|nr:hypothetical protein [Streptomyces roseoverticillatus]MCF3104587.1 hypothetical protein [Streptomyces roseoverticillatus]